MQLQNNLNPELPKMNKKYTELKELGEFGLIKRLTDNFKLSNKQSIVGIGDDAAVLEYNNEQIVVTNDILVEGVHFDLAYTPLKHLGYKAVTVNVSDVLAMNAIPKQILVSIAVSNRFSVEHLEEIYAGIKVACKDYKVDLVGGDTSSSNKGLFISITAIGSANKDDIVLRSTASAGDMLFVSGDLGAAYMGLQLLDRENKIFQSDGQIQPDLSGYDYILERQLKPYARIDIVDYLKRKNIKPTAMIDVSDGLSSEAIHLCMSANPRLGCELFAANIPIVDETADIANEFGIEPTVCALNGGEDYELLIAIKPDDYHKVKNNDLLTQVGVLVEEEKGMNLVDAHNNKIELKAQGWNAFLEQKQTK